MQITISKFSTDFNKYLHYEFSGLSNTTINNIVDEAFFAFREHIVQGNFLKALWDEFGVDNVYLKILDFFEEHSEPNYISKARSYRESLVRLNGFIRTTFNSFNDLPELIDNEKGQLLLYCVNMSMSYSYKPILIKALTAFVDNNPILLSDVINYFINYYKKRSELGLFIEQNNSVFSNLNVNYESAAKTLVNMPIKVLANKDLLSYSNGDIYLPEHIRQEIIKQKNEIISLCDDALDRYYARFSSAETSSLNIPNSIGFAKKSLVVRYMNHETDVLENSVVFDGSKRYYLEDLTKRDYFLENTTPFQLFLCNHIIEEHSWGSLLAETVKLLLVLYPNVKNLLSFQSSWSKAAMFVDEPKKNYRELNDELYINCNHTAVHSCWFLQDILDFYKIEKNDVVFLIHRPAGAEPQNIRNHIESYIKEDFQSYLIHNIGKTQEQAIKIINIIIKYLNPILSSISKSYNNFFLFDDNTILASYSYKVKEKISQNIKFDDKSKKILNKCIDYLNAYYKKD